MSSTSLSRKFPKHNQVPWSTYRDLMSSYTFMRFSSEPWLSYSTNCNCLDSAIPPTGCSASTGPPTTSSTSGSSVDGAPSPMDGTSASWGCSAGSELTRGPSSDEEAARSVSRGGSQGSDWSSWGGGWSAEGEKEAGLHLVVLSQRVCR